VTERVDRAVYGRSPLGGGRAARLAVADVGVETEIVAEPYGCCGPVGDRPNVRCACGRLVGRYGYDCTSPVIELAVDLERVIAADDDDIDGEVIGVFEGREKRAFCAWLHDLLRIEGWFGEDVLKLLASWARAPAAAGVIAWTGAEPETFATISVAEDFEALAHHTPRLDLVVPLPV
jgi:hypothetical protein